MLPVAILAGGLATRLRPITQTLPKALVDVGGEPFAFHQLRLLRRKGIEEIVFCVGHLGEQLVDAVGDGARFGLRVRYSHDGPHLLGTAGALKKAAPLLGANFFVLYGDAYLDCDYLAVERTFRASGAAALMTVFCNDGQWDASNVEFGDGRIIAYSKTSRSARMRHIDYGLGVLAADVLDTLPAAGPQDLAALYEQLSMRGDLAAFEVSQRFYEVGSFAGLEQFEKFLREDMPMSYARKHLNEAAQILERIDVAAIERLVSALAALRERGGRLFFLGVGGSAGNCSHAVNDFRKLAGIESYAPTDNVSELTARTNDEGWDTVFSEWLKVSRLGARDAVFVLSVGGGNIEKNISANLVSALRHAKEVGAAILGIVGRDGGFTATAADVAVIIPTVNPETITPHTEAFQAVVWHLLVSHPLLKARETKWESAVR
jgi:D-sedoheptulose 7-phosphate isomerase